MIARHCLVATPHATYVFVRVLERLAGKIPKTLGCYLLALTEPNVDDLRRYPVPPHLNLALAAQGLRWVA